MTVDSLTQALARWQDAAGPFWMYVLAAPFLASEPTALATARPVLGRPGTAARKIIDSLRQASEDERPAVFVDLPPEQTLPLAPALNAARFIVVPAIQRWPASPAVLSCRRLIGQLLAASEMVRPLAGPRGVVFLLDGRRAGQLPPSPEPEEPRSAFDNRYGYPICRFPPPDLLRAQSIASAQWHTTDGLAPDLLEYAQLIRGAQFPTTTFSHQPT